MHCINLYFNVSFQFSPECRSTNSWFLCGLGYISLHAIKKTVKFLLVGQRENPSNFLLMYAIGPNVTGVIGTACAAGVLLTLFGN